MLLVIDSFRADKFYGERKTSLTPNLDKLLDKGILFSTTVSSAPSSIPAISSILTGRYPFSTLYLEKDIYNLKKDTPTFIHELKNNGYQTHATIPKILTLMNLEHIFDENIDQYDDELTLYDGIGEKVLEKIKILSNEEPWFYYLHLNDIHGQAKFHKENIPEEFFEQKYGNNQYDRMISLMDKWLGKIFEKIDFRKTMLIVTADHGSNVGAFNEEMDLISDSEREKVYVKKSYLIKIGQKITNHLPVCFSPLRKKLSQKYKEKRDTKVEEKTNLRLNEIDLTESSSYKKRILKNMITAMPELYDDRFLIPLLYTGMSIENKKIIHHQVRSVDIFPTIFALLKIKNNFSTHGKNLLPLIENKEMNEEPAYLETHTNVQEGIRSHFVGIRTSKFKYFRGIKEQQEIFLYDLEKDPLEEDNIAKSSKEIVNQMESTLNSIKSQKM